MNEREWMVPAIQSVRRLMVELSDHNGESKPRCSECKVPGDHTWWCKAAPAVLLDGTRPYYWRD